jgi:hypothetical protein
MIMRYLLMGIFLMLLFFVTVDLSADKLYTWTDEKGNLHITETPPPKTARTKDVMSYKPRTAAQIQKMEAEARREEIQDEVVQKKDAPPETQKASAQTQPQGDDEVYIGREGKLIRRGEEGNEIRDRRQETEREYRRVPRR